MLGVPWPRGPVLYASGRGRIGGGPGPGGGAQGARGRRLRGGASAQPGAVGAGQAVMPNGVPMSWLRTSYDHPPLFVESAAGSRLRDVDGHEYADFNIADMSMFTGYGPGPVVEAVSRQVAQGSQYLLPTEDSIWVAGELARRYGLPKWQFTLAATSANTEVIRIARSSTGREKVLFFDGKYHGHFDEVLVELDGRARWWRRRTGCPPTSPHGRSWCRSTTSTPWSACSRAARWRW